MTSLSSKPVRRGRDAFLVISGSIVTNFGNSMYVIGLFAFISRDFPRPIFLGMIQIAAFLPVVLFSRKAGEIADHSYRPWMIAGTDLARSISFLLAAIVLEGSGLHPMLILVPMVLFNGCMQAGFTPSVISYLLDMGTNSKNRVEPLSLRSASAHLSSLAGQSLGAIIFVTAGLQPLLLYSAAGFAVSGLSEFFLSDSTRHKVIQFHRSRSESRSFRQSIIKQFEVIRDLDRRGSPISLLVGMQGINSMLVITLPFFLTRRLEYDPEFLGFGMASLFAGSIIMGFIHGVIPAVRQSKSAFVFFAVAMYAGSLLLMSFTRPGAYALMALLFLCGLCLSFVYLFVIRSAHVLGSKDNSGANQGSIEALNTAVLPLAYLLSSVLAEFFPLDTPWILRIAAILLLIVNFGVLIRYHAVYSSFKSFDE